MLAFYLAATERERRRAADQLRRPVQGLPRRRAGRPAHGLFALSTGGWFGEGIGASQQKWGDLPEAHTDFIFAVLGEELGLFGTLLVLGLFLTIAYAGVRVATAHRGPVRPLRCRPASRSG